MEISATAKPLPYFYVGKETAIKRVKEFQEHKHGVISTSLGKPDTKHIWYSKEHLSQLLEELKDVDGDGVRVYFGTYESTHQFAGQTCLIMVLTKPGISGGNIVHENVFVEDQPGFEHRNSLSRDLQVLPGDTSLFGNNREFNYGSPCPPLCDEGVPKIP
jgi:hypothetical protein